MKPHHALLLFWYFEEILFRCTAIPICLTWNTSNTHLTVECSVMSATDDIFIVDPVGKVRAQYMWESTLRKRRSTQGITLPFTTFKDYTEGEWICRHGKEETTSQVSYTKSISHMIDIDISAENYKLNEGNWFKLACFSCWIPHMHGVDIFVNDVLEDSIRYHDGDCYHKGTLCTTEACTCEANGRSYTWTYITALPIVQFACVMRFQDEIKYTAFNHKVELTFNGTVFTKEQNTNGSLSSSDKSTDDHRINLDKARGKTNSVSTKEQSTRGSISPLDKSTDDHRINLDKAGGKTNSGIIGYWLLGFCVIIIGIIITVIIFLKCGKGKATTHATGNVKPKYEDVKYSPLNKKK